MRAVTTLPGLRLPVLSSTKGIIFALSLCLAAWADFAGADGIVVKNAWTRASAPGQTVAGVYFDIRCSNQARLVGVISPLAETAEVHLMRMDDGVMRMRAVAAVDLPAEETVRFKPGGYHVMLFDLRQALTAGGQVPLVLLIEEGDGETTRVEVAAEIRNLDGSKPH